MTIDVDRAMAQARVIPSPRRADCTLLLDWLWLVACSDQGPVRACRFRHAKWHLSAAGRRSLIQTPQRS